MSFKDDDDDDDDDDDRESHTQYYLPTVEINNYNVLINIINLFDQPIKNGLKTYDNIKKIETGQGYNCATECLLAYPYFRKHYNLTAIELSKRQKLDADPKAIQQIKSTGNLSRAEGVRMFFIIEEAKKKLLDFPKETVKVL